MLRSDNLFDDSDRLLDRLTMTSIINIYSTIPLVLFKCLTVAAFLHPTIPPTKIGAVDAFTVTLISSNNFATGNNKNVVRLYDAVSSEEGNPEEGDDKQPYQGYNPFTGKYQSSTSPSSSSWSSSSKTSYASRSIGDGRSSSNIISIRKTIMQELTRELLEAIIEDSSSSSSSSSSPSPSDNPSTSSTSSTSTSGSATTTAVRTVLDSYRDFLLEPLEEQDAVLDPDSIYKPSMTRRQRYEAYRQEMDRRLSQARSKQAQAVLTAMKEYVLEFE